MPASPTPDRAAAGPPRTTLERLAPPPASEDVAALVSRLSEPGDVVVDAWATGGWVAAAAIERERRAMSVESAPLTRLLAELVLRPPDGSHLEAALEALAGASHGEQPLRTAVEAPFASSCARCGAPVVVDELLWAAEPADVGGPTDADATAAPPPHQGASGPGVPPGAEGDAGDDSLRPVLKRYRCGGCDRAHERQEAPITADDPVRMPAHPHAPSARAAIAARFPVPDADGALVAGLLDLHTPRQLVGLAAIVERIEGEVRAEPIEAALRLALLEALLAASRMLGDDGRPVPLEVADGAVRTALPVRWLERNPWLALEDGLREVTAVVDRGRPRRSPPPAGPTPIRDLTGLREPGAVLLRAGGTAALGVLADELEAVRERSEADPLPPVRLVLGVAPARATGEQLALAFHGTAWALGRDAAARLPIEPLLGGVELPPWGWHARALTRSLEAVARIVAAEGRVVLLLDEDEPEALAAVALAAAAAGYRVLDARLATPGDPVPLVELVPPGAPLPPGPRTRANVALPAVPGGAGDPELIPGRGLFSPPERVDARRFSATDAARVVTDAAVTVLQDRGEPAGFHRLFGDIVVALDRAGLLRRLAATAGGDGGGAPGRAETPGASPAGAGESAEPVRTALRAVGPAPEPPTDLVERLVGLVRAELERPTQRRVVAVGQDSWWLGDRDERAAAAPPLADRLEWTVFSVLSTAGGVPEGQLLDRIATLTAGPDRPDPGLVAACVASYRDPAAPAGLASTREDVIARGREHAELLAALADAGHRAGMRVWLGAREQGRRVDGGRLGDRLSPEERRVHLPLVARGAVDEIAAVDCIWYVPTRVTLLWEVEWTAMVGDVLLRRHPRIPTDDTIVRFLVVPPERVDLLRLKIDRSPVLAAALAAGNWHILKWNHLRSFLSREVPALDDLEPLLGLDPAIERGSRVVPLEATPGYP